MQPTKRPVARPRVLLGSASTPLVLSVGGLLVLAVAVALVLLIAFAIGGTRYRESIGALTGLAGEAQAGDLQMRVTSTASKVAAGSELELAVTIQNNGSSAIAVASWECGATVAVEADLAAPSTQGRSLDDPLDAELRAFALPAREAAEDGPGVFTRPPECVLPEDQRAIGDQELGAGDELHTIISWRAELVDGVPAASGDVPLTVRVAYREAGQEEAPYLPLVVTTVVTVTDGERGPISAVQALDAVISDKGFSDWLRAAPSATWTSANVFLQNLGPGDNGIVPDGPSWEVDLFRNVDGVRQSAISFVDPATGELRSVNLCTRDCGLGAE